MIPKVRWWRAKPAGELCSAATWFDARLSYPGFLVRHGRCDGNVRLFRDLHAFRAHDGAYSMDLPLTSLDEVTEPV
jgi:hypothetical protein